MLKAAKRSVCSPAGMKSTSEEAECAISAESEDGMM